MKSYNSLLSLLASFAFIFIGCQKNSIKKNENSEMITLTNPKSQNIELGRVTWLRNYDEALNQSALTKKPVLLFFQEIPGCSTCVNFGREVLSHPLMVEFIENEFVPLAIYNNRPGADAEILRKYNEPSWNNPVAHFVDSEGKDIIVKLSNNYHPLGMYEKLVEVLIVSGKPVPKYVEALGDDLKIKYGIYKSTVFETPCFWSGETTFAQHPAVKYTEAGWINGAEVVKVFYDDKKASLEDLNSFAKDEGFYKIGNHDDYRIDKEPQYYLSKSPFMQLPLSKVQRAKINVAIPYNGDPSSYLSPKQKKAFESLSSGNPLGDHQREYIKDIETAWNL